MARRRDRGLPFSFTGHARDIYSGDLNPHGLLRAQAARGALRGHLHRGERAPPATRSPRGRRAPRLPRAQRGLRAAAADGAAANGGANGPLRVLGVGRLVAKKGFDVLVEACAVLRAPAACIRGADRRPGRQARRRGAGADRRAGAGGRRATARPDGAGRAEREYRRRGRFLPPVPGTRGTTATGSPTCSWRQWRAACRSSPRASRGSRSWSPTSANGLLVPPEDPEALADALMRLHADRELAERLSRAGSDTVRERFDGERDGTAAGRPVRGSTALMTRHPRVAPRPVFCVTAQERRDLRGRRGGRAPGASCSRAIARGLGTAPDWLGAELPADEEWRIEWSKFYYGRDLAARIRGHRRAPLPAKHGSRWSARGSTRCRPGRTRATSPRGGCRTGSTRGRTSWRRRHSTASRTGWPSGVRGASREQARLVRAAAQPGAQPPHARALRAVPGRARRCPTLDPDGELLRFAMAELERQPGDRVPRRRRAPRELHALPPDRAALVPRRARERRAASGCASRPAFDAALGRACDFAAALHAARRPDPGALRRRQRALRRPARARRRLLDRPDLRWAATAGAAGRPAARDVSFPDGGYFIQRSGWGAGTPTRTSAS